MTKLDKDPSEQQEEKPGRRSARKNKKEQRDAARATTIAFSSEGFY